ncbi:MAG TPA: hypothetical protein VGP12_07150 [Nitrosospira sp.]|jgi:hypothetical protein|nr:hypothetical protein [Nitrosospira sp.]
MKQQLRAVVWCLAVLIAACIPGAAFASPFGQGVFGADVPFGSATSISIALGGDVTIPLGVSGATFVGSNSHTVTVTSLDVVGYTLYVRPTSGTAMTNGSASIPASSNSSPGTLATGTWGYNTTGSTTNFLGMPSVGAMLKDANGPFKSGDPTTVTYGAVVSNTQAAGNYTIPVTYTVVARNP